MNIVWGSLGGVKQDVSISGEEVSIECRGHRFQIHVLHPPHLQARLLPCSLKLFVYHRDDEDLKGDLSSLNSSGHSKANSYHYMTFGWQKEAIFVIILWQFRDSAMTIDCWSPSFIQICLHTESCWSPLSFKAICSSHQNILQSFNKQLYYYFSYFWLNPCLLRMQFFKNLSAASVA